MTADAVKLLEAIRQATQLEADLMMNDPYNLTIPQFLNLALRHQISDPMDTLSQLNLFGYVSWVYPCDPIRDGVEINFDPAWSHPGLMATMFREFLELASANADDLNSSDDEPVAGVV